MTTSWDIAWGGRAPPAMPVIMSGMLTLLQTPGVAALSPSFGSGKEVVWGGGRVGGGEAGLSQQGWGRAGGVFASDSRDFC